MASDAALSAQLLQVQLQSYEERLHRFLVLVQK